MDHYIDIKIQPDADMRENELLNKLYSKFHKALCDLKANDIGVSFPEYQLKLGRTLRIHGSAARLNALQQLNWLGGLSGYCKLTEIQAIPAQVQYRTVSRIQPNMRNNKLKRQLAWNLKRGQLSPEQAKEYEREYKAKMFDQGLENPYIELDSNSSGQHYRYFFAFGELLDAPVVGVFDSFGVSKTATIPVF